MKVVRLFFLLTCLSVEMLAAQNKTITSGEGVPTSHQPWYDYYLDTQHHRAYIHHPGMHGDPFWYLITDDDVLTLDVCNGFAICFDGKKYRAYNYTLALGMTAFQAYRCTDSLLWAWNQYGVRVFDREGKETRRMFGQKSFGCETGGSVADTVGGKLAFCVLLPQLDGYSAPCEDLKAWGMMGLDFNWIIEPKYDEPFNFHNGVAEVVLYGKRLKINEAGEQIVAGVEASKPGTTDGQE